MDNKYEQSIDLLREDLAELQAKATEIQFTIHATMKMINRFLVKSGEEEEFKDLSQGPGISNVATSGAVASSGGGGNVSSRIEIGDFISVPLTKAVRKIIEMNDRKPMLWSAIVEALRKGGHPKVKTAPDEKKARLIILRATGWFFFQKPDFFGLRERSAVKKPKTSAKSDETNGVNSDAEVDLDSENPPKKQ